MLVYQRVGSMVLLNIWCHMDPIKKYPSHVSINIPAPAGSVMGLIINPPWPLTCNLTIWHSQWHIKIYKVNPPDSSHLQSLCVVTIPIINFGECAQMFTLTATNKSGLDYVVQHRPSHAVDQFSTIYYSIQYTGISCFICIDVFNS